MSIMIKFMRPATNNYPACNKLREYTNPTLAQLNHEIITDIFKGVIKNPSFTVKHVDDGEEITITIESEQELEDALKSRSKEKPVFTMYVAEKDQAAPKALTDEKPILFKFMSPACNKLREYTNPTLAQLNHEIITDIFKGVIKNPSFTVKHVDDGEEITITIESEQELEDALKSRSKEKRVFTMYVAEKVQAAPQALNDEKPILFKFMSPACNKLREYTNPTLAQLNHEIITDIFKGVIKNPSFTVKHVDDGEEMTITIESEQELEDALKSRSKEKSVFTMHVAEKYPAPTQQSNTARPLASSTVYLIQSSNSAFSRRTTHTYQTNQ